MDAVRVNSIYAIYNHPSDFPNSWVVREWRRDKSYPEEALLFETLREARQSLPTGLTLVSRDAQDDLVIFETWL